VWVDLTAGVLVFESLKKRRTGIFRGMPVPPALLDMIDLVHGIRELHAAPQQSTQVAARGLPPYWAFEHFERPGD
jgi:hypothetical protein